MFDKIKPSAPSSDNFRDDRKQASSYNPSQNHNPAATNFVSKDVTITGKLKLTGDINIDGKVDGEISSKGVVILNNNAVVKGNVIAKEIIVSGKVEGNLSATARLEINQTANVNGDIKTAVLKVDPGASFSGGCQVGSGVKIEEPKPSSSSSVPAKKEEPQKSAVKA